jgi:DNA-binding IclR family transcriptional regulator
MEPPNTPSKVRYTSSVPAVEQTARILLFLASAREKKANLTEICNTVKINHSKGYAILNTLQNFGIVVREPQSKAYSLGPGLISLGQRAQDSISSAKLAQPFVDTLSSETQSSAAFGLVAGDTYFWIAKHDIGEAVGLTLQLGYALPIAHGAHGIVMLTFMSEEQRAPILQKGHHFYKEEPTNDRERLAREMEECRSIGYAEYQAKVNPMIRIVAAPVFGHDATPIGALEIVGIFPASQTAANGAKLVKEARNLSILLGADPKSLPEIFDQAQAARLARTSLGGGLR